MTHRKGKKKIRLPHNPGGETAPPGLPKDKKDEAWQGVLSTADIVLQLFAADATKAGAGKGGAFGKGPANLTQAPATALFFKQLADQSDFQPAARLAHDDRWKAWKFMATDHLNQLSKQIGSTTAKQTALANAWAQKAVSASILLRTQQTPHVMGKDISPSQLFRINTFFGGPENYIGFEQLGHGSWAWDLEDLFGQLADYVRSIKDALWDQVNYSSYMYELWAQIRGIWLNLQQNTRAIYDALINTVSGTIDQVGRQIMASAVSIGNYFVSGLNSVWADMKAFWALSWTEQLNVLRELHIEFQVFLLDVVNTVALHLYEGYSRMGNSLNSAAHDVVVAMDLNLERIHDGMGKMIPDALAIVGERAAELIQETMVDFKTIAGKALEVSRGAVVEFVKEGYSEIEQYLRAQAPITPQKVPAVAAATLGTAIAFGTAAHLSSSFFEFAHPLKSLGLHQMSAFLADMGSFSAISAGSMGVMIATAVRQPFMYYAQDIFRPLIASEMDLQIMAVKPDITMEDFRRAYAFHGYSDRWIDAIQTTMFKEPRYFELSFMLEDANASQDWLYKKARRGGYSVEDSNIFVPGLIKKVLRTQRQDLYVAVGRLYKEGYIDDAQFDEMLAPLELRSEALPLAKQAAAAQFLYDNIYELSRLLREEYIKEVITLGDLEVALTSLGISDAKIDLLLASAMVKKMPKPKHIEKKEADKEAAKMQRKYVTLYTQQYRKELLSADELQTNLVMIGLTPEMAGITVSLEKTRRLEVPSVVKARTTAKANKESQKIYTALYKEQFRDKEISEEELTFYLMTIGYPPEDAVGMVRLEQAKAYTPPSIELEPVTA